MVTLLIVFSLVTFVASLFGIPWLIGRLDTGYFRAFALRVKRGEPKERTGAFFVWALVRNTCGMVLVALGLVMLVLPGQGLITLVFGLSLLDFPGKPKLLAWILQRKAVQRTMNWIRRKQGKDEFLFF
ncbi:MAG: PGPGW domain-containing protein [Desulfobulbus sp.]|jgi:hypothetical protein